MRIALPLLALLALAVPPATAAKCPPACVAAGVEPTLPSDGCGDCAGATVYAHTLPPTGCYDCDTVGVAVGAGNDDDGTTVSVKACKGGFVHICVIDEEVTV